MPPGVPVYPVLEALIGRASRLHPLPDDVPELGRVLVPVHRFHVLHQGFHLLLFGICQKRHGAFDVAPAKSFTTESLPS